MCRKDSTFSDAPYRPKFVSYLQSRTLNCPKPETKILKPVLSLLLSRPVAVRLMIAGGLQSVCVAACPCFVEILAAKSVVVEVGSCPLDE